MKIDYYPILLKALQSGDVERRTGKDGESVEIIQSGKTLYSDGDIKGEYLTEYIKAEPHIVVFGAGHVSKALYEAARLLRMEVTVIDEREETANKERFPEAEVICISYDEFFSSSSSFFRPYFVIMTHGHAYDSKALEWCLKQPSSYIGMIGSKAKVAATFEKMREKGFREEDTKYVHAPIGLKIGAVTPEEIAVSILSEIISVFRSIKTAFTISDKYLSDVSGKKGICARIIAKTGSAPRAIGSELFYSALEDKFYGTVGGGAVEKATEDECRKLSESGDKSKIIHFNLSPKGDLSMTCGGDVDMLFSRVE